MVKSSGGTWERRQVISTTLGIGDEGGIDRGTAESLLRTQGNRPRVHRADDARLIALRGVNRTLSIPIVAAVEIVILRHLRWI